MFHFDLNTTILQNNMPSKEVHMFGKISIRNIPAAIWEGLENLASQHDRSTEAEARYALRSWVEPLLKNNERSARRNEVSARLRDLLDQVNKIYRGRPIKPSHIAEEINEDRAESVENWFTGEIEPSFKQLDAVADYLGGTKEWLKHGDGRTFPVRSERVPEDPVEGVNWLLDLDQERKVTFLHLIRDANETGTLAIVKQYGDWHCKTFTTPYHISEEIGSGGESSLAHLSIILQMLYMHYTKKGGNLVIKSYLLPTEGFDLLCGGQLHPLSILRDGGVEAPWWEDFWDITQFRKQNYWVGWKSVCERIYRVIELRPNLHEKRMQISSQEHPFLQP